ncbi:MAG: hypothetical protein WB755_28285, partial [Terriglobales bacterium]
MKKFPMIAGLLVCLASTNALAMNSASDAVAAAENTYADVLDSYGAFSTIDSGLMKTYEGKDRAAWERIYREKRTTFAAQLSKLAENGLSKTDARAVKLMRSSLSDFPEDASTLSPTHKCKDAQRTDLDYAALHAALYACFDE